MVRVQSPESPVFHAYFDLIGPVKFCFALQVSFSSVCVCIEFESACICNVREHDNLEFFSCASSFGYGACCV